MILAAFPQPPRSRSGFWRLKYAARVAFAIQAKVPRPVGMLMLLHVPKYQLPLMSRRSRRQEKNRPIVGHHPSNSPPGIVKRDT
jgi:hypothetical protein